MQRDTVLVLIGLMAGGLISLFLGYFVNLTTPDLQQTILEWQSSFVQQRAKKSVKKAQKNVDELEHEIGRIEGFYERPVSFIAYAFLRILVCLVELTLSLLSIL